MSTRLTYFGFDGSRGLECRIALTLAGVPFEDHRIGREEWGKMKPTTPFGGLPILEVDGRTLPQCNAILTYVGRAHGLHPTDAWEAAEHEALMCAVEDLRSKIPGGDLGPEEKKAAREAFAAGWLTWWATAVSERIQGPFVAGDKLNVVDLKIFTILRSFKAGAYDHLPYSFFDAWPKLAALQQAVEEHPGVKAYFASLQKA